MPAVRRAIAVLAVPLAAWPLLPADAQHTDIDLEAAGAVQQVRTSLPPGNSMTYRVADVAVATVSGDPADYGPNADDQREAYWNYEFKDGRLVDGCDEPEVPRDGVEICWSDFGVPAVFGGTTEDLGFGAGWAHARLRLFLLDAIRRTARGTLAELAGPGTDGATLAADVRIRYQAYSADELRAMYEAAGSDARAMVDGYVAGVNAWIGQVLGPQAGELPAEYGVLQTVPAELTVEDVVAIGVLMTRTVASEGKREFMWVRALRALEETHGTELGRAIFRDFVWDEDTEAVTTVLAEEGRFPRTDARPAERDAAFEAMADFAATLPHDLDSGPGADPDRQAPTATEAATTAAAANPAAQAVAALEQWRATLAGGSWQVSLAPSMTDGSTLLVSEPQLGYNPTLLVEFQLTGAGYHVRGVGVPGLPVVGIGYTPTVAWSLTTGNSKTVDTFVDTVRPDSDGDGAPEVLHNGQWVATECRTETVRHRQAPGGVPIGLPVESVDHLVCVGPHGPIVSPAIDQIDDPAGEPALSYQWHMRDHEVETFEGVLDWMQANTADDIIASIPKLTWNENIGWADAFGHIGWWHPGRHLAKADGVDLRLPTPGTGEFDNGEPLPADALPHVVDPARGWITNWNNRPAHGWLAGGGQSETSIPGGSDQRNATLADVVSSRDDWTFDDLVDLDRQTSSRDFRARHFLPLLVDLQGDPALSPAARQAIDLLAGGWDGSANGPGADMAFSGYDGGDQAASVGAAATFFDRTMTALVEELFADLRSPTYTVGDQEFTFDLVGRQLEVGRHVYEMSPPLQVVLRALDPSTSSLGTAMDYLDGRTSRQALLDVVQAVADELEAEQGADASAWRQPYTVEPVCSPTGVIGPCGVMPFLERGTWIHQVGWPAPAPDPDPTTSPVPTPAPAPDPPLAEPPLPATGGGLVAMAAVTLVGAAALRRRGQPNATSDS